MICRLMRSVALLGWDVRDNSFGARESNGCGRADDVAVCDNHWPYDRVYPKVLLASECCLTSGCRRTALRAAADARRYLNSLEFLGSRSEDLSSHPNATIIRSISARAYAARRFCFLIAVWVVASRWPRMTMFSSFS